MSDVIADESMDDATRADMQAYTGCIAGALTHREFTQALADAGPQPCDPERRSPRRTGIQVSLRPDTKGSIWFAATAEIGDSDEIGRLAGVVGGSLVTEPTMGTATPTPGTLFYVKGSHRWGAHPPEAEPLIPSPPGPVDPDDTSWTVHLRQISRRRRDRTASARSKGRKAAFHSGWTWHGSGPNTRTGTVLLHGSLPRGCGEVPPDRTRPDLQSHVHAWQRDLDESTFPILWSADGYRSPWIHHYLSEIGQFFNSESAMVKQAVDFSAINTEPWNLEAARSPGRYHHATPAPPEGSGRSGG